mmetsp:Transcript_24451/g.52723  ORF Transcript_24451/g.52723 Transcript_24451/m.52723 type:complete len:246 (-) Transcript_24451:109-846(-)
MSFALPLFLVGYRSAPRAADNDELEESHTLCVKESLWRMVGDYRFSVHAISCSLLGGVSFAVPAVQDLIFGADCDGSLDLPSSSTTWTNFALIASGIIAGVLFGQCVGEGSQSAALLILFFASSLAITALMLLTTPVVLHEVLDSGVEKESVFAMLVPLMAIFGVGSLGFIGIGIRVAVQLRSDVSEVFTAGALEFFVQGFGALFGQISGCELRLIPCTIAVWTAFVGIATVHGAAVYQSAQSAN